MPRVFKLGLHEILDILGSQSVYIVERWRNVFGDAKFYC